MTLVLVAISSANVICTLPKFIITILQYKTGSDIQPAHTISSILIGAYFSCHSIIYFYISSDCRKEVKQLFSKCLSKAK